MADEVGTALPLTIHGWAQAGAGQGNYRVGVPLWGLAGAGHRTQAVVGSTPAWDADVVIGQLIIDEPRLYAWRELARRPGRRPILIAEIDDDLWNIHDANIHAEAFRDPELIARAEEGLRLADAVTVTTDHLAEVVSRFNDNVYVLPNYIDLNLILRQRPPSSRTTVGWTVSVSHLPEVDDLSGALSRFLRNNPEVDLHLIGQDFRSSFTAPNLRWTAWTNDLGRYLDTIDFDLGIAPLIPHAFNKSRSDIKVLEYAALGIPVVASDYGPYRSSVVHGETGFLVKHPHEWAKYLKQLIDDAPLRQLMGISAKLWASDRTIQGNVWRWEQAFRETISRVHGDPVRGMLAPVPAPAAAV